LKPHGEGQLERIMKEIQKRYGTDMHYPKVAELLDLLYHSDTSPYDGLVMDGEILNSTVYVSYAQSNAKRLQRFVLDKLGGPPQLMLEVGSFLGSGVLHTWAPLVANSSSLLSKPRILVNGAVSFD